MDAIIIQSSSGPYEVTFQENIAQCVARLAVEKNRLFVVDSRVAAWFREELRSIGRSQLVEIEATEDQKTLGGCEAILAALVGNNADRSTSLVAIGGGIIQDMVTLCAHLYFRGIDWIFIPTTMLAMADSCVGAKASINFRGYKNQLGVFHSPKEVNICTGFLQTLPEHELRSGFGEAFKLHFAAAPERFFVLAAKIEVEGWRTRSVSSIVRDCLEIKKGYIESDEFDRGIRRNLNYGHTFGHALEAVTAHKVPHGLAVCWGMDLINFLALRRGRIQQQFFDKVHSRLKQLFSWSVENPILVETLIAAARRDKKSINSRLSLIMPDDRGSLEIVRQDFDEALVQDIDTYLSTFSLVTISQNNTST